MQIIFGIDFVFDNMVLAFHKSRPTAAAMDWLILVAFAIG
jgi:hypothetical protein